jgi:hypothetical protein
MHRFVARFAFREHPLSDGNSILLTARSLHVRTRVDAIDEGRTPLVSLRIDPQAGAGFDN